VALVGEPQRTVDVARTIDNRGAGMRARADLSLQTRREWVLRFPIRMPSTLDVALPGVGDLLS